MEKNGSFSVFPNHLLHISNVNKLLKQAPRISRASLVKGPRSQSNTAAQQTLIAHWKSIVKNLDSYLKTMRANFVSFHE